jgi:hypothetical protein
MRRLVKSLLLVLMVGAVLVPGGCRRQEKARVQATEEESPELASIVHVADPQAAPQLLKGFHELEQNSWRWTMGKFSVILRPPGGSAEKGARLQSNLSVPDPVIQNLQSVSLTAIVNGVALPPETFTKPGDYTFSREVPASALSAPSVVVDFALDKCLQPGRVDQRELGIVVTTIGLEPK